MENNMLIWWSLSSLPLSQLGSPETDLYPDEHDYQEGKLI